MSHGGRFLLGIVIAFAAGSCAVSASEDAEIVDEGDLIETSALQAQDTVTLDPKLAVLPGSEEALASDYCCRARLIGSENWHCVNLHTNAVFAAAACSAALAGVPIVDGIRFSKQHCNDVPECP